MKCLKCGIEISGYAKFCGYCGAQLTDTPPAAPVYAPRVNKRERPKTSAKQTALSAFAAVLLFVSAVCAVSLAHIRTAAPELTKNDAIYDGIIENSDVSAIIYGQLDANTRREYGITEHKVQELLKKDAVREFLGDQIDLYIKAVADGKNYEIDPDDVIDMIDENKRDIEAITGYEITRPRLEKIRNSLENGGTLKKFSVNRLDASSGGLLRHAGIFLTVWPLAGAVALCAVFAALIIVINRREITAAPRYCGIGLFAAGTVCFASGVAMPLAMRGAAAALSEIGGLLLQFAEIAGQKLFASGLFLALAGVILFAAGLLTASVVYGREEKHGG